MTRAAPRWAAALLAALASVVMAAAGAQALTPHQQLARDILQELVEIDTVTASGDTLKAAQAMAARLRAAGFAEADVRVLSAAPRKGNLVARLRGSGARRPILLLAHLDVVPAKPEDWSVDPFRLLERDGYFYGRGVEDDKSMAAALVANLIRYRQEGFRPERDLIVVLETDEEIGDANQVGIRWLLQHHRELIDAEFALNEGGGVGLVNGRATIVSVQTSEKVPLNFRLEVKSAGGHSSLPTRDNAIYRLSDGLVRLSRFEFPFRLTDTTRSYFERRAALAPPALAAELRAILAPEPDAAAMARLSRSVGFNVLMRTTCVATMLEAGHAANALPQMARATVNCRVLPGESFDDVRQTLEHVLDDQRITVTPTGTPTPSPPSPLNPDLMRAVERLSAEFWPGTPVLPTMLAGATDGRFLRNAGIPTYGHSGLASDLRDVRVHGKDERIGVRSFYDGQEYLYRLVKALASDAR